MMAGGSGLMPPEESVDLGGVKVRAADAAVADGEDERSAGPGVGSGTVRDLEGSAHAREAAARIRARA